MFYFLILFLILALAALAIAQILKAKIQESGNNPITVYDAGSDDPRHHFRATEITLRENKVMIVTMDDGIYVRLAGSPNKGEAFRCEWAKVVDFSKNKSQMPGLPV